MNASEVGAALDEMHIQEHTKHYMAECPNCRRVNKVPIKQLRRRAPRDWSPPTDGAKKAKADSSAATNGEKKEGRS